MRSSEVLCTRHDAPHDARARRDAPSRARVRTADGRVTGYYEYGDPRRPPGDRRCTARPRAAPASRGPTSAPARAASACSRPTGPASATPNRGRAGPGAPSPTTRRSCGRSPTRSTSRRSRSSGYSGGGPYALAAAHALADRIPAAAVVSGAGQVGVWASVRDFEPTDRLPHPARGSRARRWRASCWRRRRAPRDLAPRTSLRFAQIEMSAADRAVMAAVPLGPRRARGVQPVVSPRRARRRRRLRRARPAVGLRGRGDLGPGALLARDRPIRSSRSRTAKSWCGAFPARSSRLGRRRSPRDRRPRRRGPRRTDSERRGRDVTPVRPRAER